jgi:hypothetical protein
MNNQLNEDRPDAAQKMQEQHDAWANANQATREGLTIYPIHISSDLEELLVFQSEPTNEIRLKGKKISIEKLIELLKKIEYNGE